MKLDIILNKILDNYNAKNIKELRSEGIRDFLHFIIKYDKDNLKRGVIEFINSNNLREREIDLLINM